ncbi:multidrug effflux MFS transporter [Nocardioides limicola]|uniref:multidrug effflux MFS transporter n=1 Tax=Nocardioides limicola TaxID=2803368 RepID=UPI00193C0BD2|nr:multidrug effflux MFS transporter [Nocardioides sp. DJM-14]
MVVLGCLIALGPLTIDMYLPAFPRIARDFDASSSAVQLTLTGMLAGLAVGQLVIGPLSDAFGRLRPLLVGLAVHAVASIACAIAPTIEVLAAFRVVQGFAGAAVSVTAMAMVRDRFSGIAMARLMARLILVIGLAPIIAPSLGGVLLTWFDWPVIFLVLAAVALLLIVVAVTGMEESLPPARRRQARPVAIAAAYRMLLREPQFVALATIGGAMMATLFAYVAGASFVLQEGFGVSERTFALIFGANAAGFVVGSQINPILLRRFRMVDVLTGGILAALTGGVALTVSAATGFGGLAGVLLPLAIVMGAAGFSMPNTPALALDAHGGEAGTAAAVLGFFQFGIGALVAPLVGAFGTGNALPMGVVMMVMAGLAAVLAFTVVRPRFRVTGSQWHT